MIREKKIRFLFNDNNVDLLPISILTRDGKDYIEYSILYFVLCGKVVHVKNSTKGISINEKIEISNTNRKGTKTFLSEAAVVQLISRNSHLSHSQKEDSLAELQNIGFLKKKFLVFSTSKESCFGDELSYFLRAMDLTLNRQISIKKYSVDFSIMVKDALLFIEYDECGHLGYDKEKELRRQKVIEGYCTELIRLNDKNNNSYNIGLVAKSIYRLI